MRRVCVTMRGTRVGRQFLCVRTGSKPRRSTSVHWRPTFILRMNRACITFIAERKYLYVERSRSVRVGTRSVSDSCVGRASNVRGILHRICSYASTCAIFQWFVSDCKWYVRGSWVIDAWFVSDFFPRQPEKLVNFSTHKHAHTQSVRDLCVIGCVTGPLHNYVILLIVYIQTR